jgi:vitamin B12 transporter
MLVKSALSAAILTALSFSVSAQKTTTENIERITVTANKFEQSIRNSLATIHVIERAEIENSNIRDLPSLLNTVAGIDVVRSGGFGQEASVFVRGAATKYTLVLVDGVRISDANSGSVSFTNIPVNSIEKIEIVKGARAAVYGSDAMSGVINIITRKAIAHEVTLTSGSHNYVNYQQAGEFNKKNMTLGYNLGYEDTKGYDVTAKDPIIPVGKDHDSDGYNNRNIGFNLTIDTQTFGQLNAIVQYSEGDAEYDNAWGNDAYDFENYSGKIAWQKKIDQFEHIASVSHSQEENSQTGTTKQDIYSTDRLEIEYRSLYRFNETTQLTGGMNYLTEDLGGSSAVFSETQRDNQALFFGGFYDDERWLANVVLRTDDYEYHGRANTYTTALGLKPHRNVTFRVNHGTAFRAPSLTNAFVSQSPWYLPNLNIKPEEATNNEIGMSLSTRWGQYDVAIFQNKIDNLITNLYDTDSGKYIPYNVDKSTMKGVELSAHVNAFGFKHSINATFLDAKDSTTGEKLARRPSESFNYTVARSWDKLDVNVAMSYRSSRPSIALYDMNLGQSVTATLAGYTVFNLSANYKFFDGLTLNARLENITGKDYITAASGYASDGSLLGYTALGRQAYVGATVYF